MSGQTSLCECFNDLIHDDWKLQRTGSFWQIQEPGAGNSLFEIGGGQSVAFSLDKPCSNPFPSFSTALKGVRQVNDAMVIAQVDGHAYVAAVEMKTSRSATDAALQQIESGRLFVEWASNLLLTHGHWTGASCTFFGIVSLKPRQQPRKGTSRRSAELPDPDYSRHGSGYPVFVLENHPRASVIDLVRKLGHNTKIPGGTR